MVNYVLFVCGHNAGRSQMAQSFFNYGIKEFSSIDEKYEAISAGTRHGDAVNPLIVQAMEEIGIDINDTTIYFPKGLDDNYIKSRGSNVERVIVACNDKCELPPEMRADLTPEYWNIPDTHGKLLDEVRRVRDLIKDRVSSLLKELVAVEKGITN